MGLRGIELLLLHGYRCFGFNYIGIRNRIQSYPLTGLARLWMVVEYEVRDETGCRFVCVCVFLMFSYTA